MQNEIVEVVASLTESFITVDFLARFLTAKNKKNKLYFYFLCMAMLFADVHLQNHFIAFEGLAGLTQILIGYLAAQFFLKGKASEKLFAAVLSCIPIIIINISTLSILQNFTSESVEQLILERGFVRILTLFITKFLYFLATRYLIGIRRKGNYVLSLTEWAAVILVFFTTLIIGISYLELTYTNNIQSDGKISAGIIAGLIIVNVLTYFLLLKISRENKQRTRYAMMEIQLREQEKSMRMINKSYSEIMKIRHDMKNYLSCALSLLKEGEYQRAEEYLESIFNERIGTIVQYVNTQSSIINAVINSKLSKCVDDDIEFDYKVTGSVCDFDEIELGILISNLFDNAIEASLMNKAEKKIEIEICDNKGYLCIMLKNRIDAPVIDNNPELVTSKADKKRHGIGLRSVRDIVEKHDGIMNLSEEESNFVADIWLRKPKI